MSTSLISGSVCWFSALLIVLLPTAISGWGQFGWDQRSGGTIFSLTFCHFIVFFVAVIPINGDFFMQVIKQLLHLILIQDNSFNYCNLKLKRENVRHLQPQKRSEQNNLVHPLHQHPLPHHLPVLCWHSQDCQEVTDEDQAEAYPTIQWPNFEQCWP